MGADSLVVVRGASRRVNLADQLLYAAADADTVEPVLFSPLDVLLQILKSRIKILQALTKSGFIETVRGRSGGIRLAMPANEIRLGRVVRNIEDNFDLVECFQPGDAECPLISSCGMSEALRDALDAFFAVLDGFTIADLTDKQRNIGILARLELLKSEPLPAH